MGDIWRVIIWMLITLRSGVFPNCDWDGVAWPIGSWRARVAGTPITPGLFYTLWEIAGDYEWLANEIGLQHWSNPNPCSWCPCDKGLRLYSDFRPTSLWMPLVYVYEWIIAHPPEHPLFNTPGLFCNLYFVILDLMHVLFLGVGQHICGNVIYTLAHDSGLLGNAQVRCFHPFVFMI